MLVTQQVQPTTTLWSHEIEIQGMQCLVLDNHCDVTYTSL